MIDLTKREELILISIWKLSGDAYIVTIRKHLKEITGQSLNYGSLCNTLNALARKGFIQSQESAPKAIQGGRRKVLYTLTIEGKKALRRAYEIQKHVWDGITGLVLGVE